MSHWPAMKKWVDLEYLLKTAGSRTVPIEIGSHYTDPSWSQKLMTLEEFIKNHYLSDSGDVGYLAQHNLFDQVSKGVYLSTPNDIIFLRLANYGLIFVSLSIVAAVQIMNNPQNQI